MEQHKGHTGNNIVTVLMRSKGLSLQSAADYVGVYFNELMHRFIENRKSLPLWGGSLDVAVDSYS